MQTVTAPSTMEKVVIRLGSESVCGYLDCPEWKSIESELGKTLLDTTQTLNVRLHASDSVEEIPIAELKAIFFVNSFEGNPARNHINFHTRTPIVGGVWIRLEFCDGEVMEGIVQNSLRYLVEPGFFLLPTDPESNNKLVYIFKRELVDYRVLGLRAT